ncbi:MULTISPECIES: cob(I)yrinic acid a,c-diamide adenosyltransferase [Salinivibrio]|uniref:cob(I)yrinic acid a,c-diamide adenosyltransferase n=1 Tax=Salinivibrio TaxID=51366 RepID=UPI00098994C4|nr:MULTISPECIES: cob(I)yrinic acid a,c-diamide adenosyltransferase [Salinivibrio]OOF10470.1 cob(I)yrinic acid a,c-diamide adenosyltransferase [Salinivibrio sp. PR5]OOF32294.1 cob(I)yrinic acid a,c-diamide adenosyltransferase [Salinivibrio proteolyticus]
MSEQGHKKRQQKLKEMVDARVEAAQQEKGLLLIMTGNGKGKSTSAFGTVARATGHGLKCGVAQFIKGTWACGERDLLSQHGVDFHVMGTGFTWDTQDKTADTEAAQQIWQHCQAMLADPNYDLVVLDEITYMITYGYIELESVVAALQARPADQSVIITGRGAHRQLVDMADTVSEVRNVKHAFDAGIKARQGIDW